MAILSSHLFMPGPYTSNAGLTLPFSVECDTLTDVDLEVIAQVMATRVPAFARTEGTETGGARLADAMRQYAKPGARYDLICDDVLITGQSMEVARGSRTQVHGLVIFAHNKPPRWVTPMWITGATV